MLVNIDDFGVSIEIIIGCEIVGYGIKKDVDFGSLNKRY